MFILMLALSASDRPVLVSQSEIPPRHFHCTAEIDIAFVDLGQEAVFIANDHELRLKEKPFAFGRRFTDDRWTIIVDGKKMVIASTDAPGLTECAER